MENTAIDVAEANRRMRVGGRRLVSVRKIDAIEDIPNADLIKAAVIGGWKVVVKAGEFQPGDLCVFFEIDSFLPADDPRYEFLLKNKTTWMGKEGIRLRTIRLRRALSQGLALPLGSFPEIESELKFVFDTFKATPQCDDPHYENMDFTDLLKVDKWEPIIDAHLAGLAKGNFPSFIPKTSAERCQNLKREIFSDIDVKFEVTVKLDGSSITNYVKTEEGERIVGVCSRNLELKLDQEGNTFVDLSKQSGLLDVLRLYPQDIAVQAEMLAPGVQKNREQVPYPQFHVFKIFDINKGEYLTPPLRLAVYEQLRVIAKEANIPLELYHTPVLHEGISLRELGITSIDGLLQYAEGPSLNHPLREGLVFKAVDSNFSFKVIANSYLENEK